MAIKATTASGRSYIIDRDNQFWRRLPKSENEYTMGWERIWVLKVGTHFNYPHLSPDGTWVDAEYPEIGKFMYISAKDFWWVTTEIVSIEDAPSFEDSVPNV